MRMKIHVDKEIARIEITKIKHLNILMFKYMKNVLFVNNQIDFRGTSVAIYDYAHYNEEILHNNSYVAFKTFENHVIKRFTDRFKCFKYETVSDIEILCKRLDINIVYIIKYGKNDKLYLSNVKTCIHCVFDLSEPHGDVYCAVSKTLALKYNRQLYVPHMISLIPDFEKRNLRQKLSIPNDAIVFGRYGGVDTFNLKFALRVIYDIAKDNSNIFFVFMNTFEFVRNHPNIIFLSPSCDETDKNMFINTCDAYIECGTLGHTFGLAIGEFSVNNKPIIAFKPKSFEQYTTLWNSAHIDILGNKGIYYETEDEFKTILLTFNPNKYKELDMNCYRDYTPSKVMKQFNEVFLS